MAAVKLIWPLVEGNGQDSRPRRGTRHSHPIDQGPFQMRQLASATNYGPSAPSIAVTTGSVNRRCLGVRRLRWPAPIKIGACQLRTPTGPVKVRMSLLLEVLAADEGCSSSGFSQLCRHIPGCPRRYYNLDPIPQWKKY
jgi:hypothetical protein